MLLGYGMNVCVCGEEKKIVIKETDNILKNWSFQWLKCQNNSCLCYSRVKSSYCVT